MKIDRLTSIIIKYGEKFERELKSLYYTQSERDRMLNNWIKDKLEFCKNNPNVSEDDLIKYINSDNSAKLKN